jgi:photosystem II stability/assembly factor-like uncharacterized protein
MRRKTVREASRRASSRLVVLLAVLSLSPFPFSLSSPSARAQGAWRRQSSGTMAWLRSVYFLDERRGWAVGGNGALLLTADGGATWKVRARPTEDALRDVYFSDAETGWLVCDRSIYALQTKDEPRSYLLRTTDGGATWKRVRATGDDVDVRLVRLLFAGRAHAWVFGEAGALYASSDGGATWARQRVPTRYLLLGGAFLADAQTGWLVGAGSVFLQTSDSGATWRAGRVETESALRPSLDAAAVNASASLASSATAPAASVSPRLNAVSFADERRGWAVGAGGRIFHTANGGHSWRAQASNVSADLFDVKFFDAQEGWAAGANGTLLHTTDGGTLWQLVPSGTEHPLERLSFVGRTHGWAVGFGGTILHYSSAPQAPTSTPSLKGVTRN